LTVAATTCRANAYASPERDDPELPTADCQSLTARAACTASRGIAAPSGRGATAAGSGGRRSSPMRRSSTGPVVARTYPD
jgi:hypothetical protein